MDHIYFLCTLTCIDLNYLMNLCNCKYCIIHCYDIFCFIYHNFKF